MISVLGNAGKQTLNQPNMSIDPQEFQKFMSQRSNLGSINDQSLINRNKGDSIQYLNQQKIKSKEDYARVLQMQIDEKKGRKQQVIQSQNANASFDQRTRILDYQKTDQQSQKYQPVYPFGTDVRNPNSDNQQQGQQSIVYQNDQRAYEQGRSIRGILKREYENQEMVSQQELRSQQYKQELLAQIEEKKQRQLQSKQQDEIEGLMYMERMKKQQEDLGQNVNLNDTRQISQLRKNLMHNESSNAPNQNDPVQKKIVEHKIPDIQPYSYAPIFIQPVIKFPEAIQPVVPEIYQPKSMIDQDQLLNYQHNYAQTRVDLDVMKQYYNYQQQVVERDLGNIKDQLSKVDSTRVAAERELMYLQERAKEKKIWSILDYQADAFMPNIAYESKQSIFRTAKYTLGHLSEAEKRQKILADFYKSDKSKLALGPIYKENVQDLRFAQNELETISELITAKNHVKQEPGEQRIFDDSQLNQIENIKNHDQIILTHVNRNLNNQNLIKDRQQYEEFLKESSLIEIMKDMQQKGDRKLMTPVHDFRSDQGLMDNLVSYKKQKSAADDVEVTFDRQIYEDRKNQQQEDANLQQSEDQDDQPQKSEQPDQSSVYELEADQHPRTEEPLSEKLDEGQEKQSRDLYNWQIKNQQEVVVEHDPLDSKINDVLDNIAGIVNTKQKPQNYFRIQLESRVKQSKPDIRQSGIPENQNPKWKPINFAKTEKSCYFRQFKYCQNLCRYLLINNLLSNISDDHLQNLDELLKKFVVPK